MSLKLVRMKIITLKNSNRHLVFDLDIKKIALCEKEYIKKKNKKRKKKYIL